MAKHFVLVSGNIGAGKTSLTEGLGAKLGWLTAYESVADNPYLADFYDDMRAWAFHLQVFFLGHRAEQHQKMARNPRSAIIDRSIFEDAEIFARVSLELGNVAQRDYETYRKLYEIVVGSLPAPDLLIYLKAPTEVLLERIRARGREMELGITADYLDLLDRHYDGWLQGFDLCPILTIRTDDLDFVHKPGHLDTVVQRVHDKLTGREELTFPGTTG
jgi:deoxyadenosine/deoxycytidine kinase